MNNFTHFKLFLLIAVSVFYGSFTFVKASFDLLNQCFEEELFKNTYLKTDNPELFLKSLQSGLPFESDSSFLEELKTHEKNIKFINQIAPECGKKYLTPSEILIRLEDVLKNRNEKFIKPLTKSIDQNIKRSFIHSAIFLGCISCIVGVKRFSPLLPLFFAGWSFNFSIKYFSRLYADIYQKKYLKSKLNRLSGDFERSYKIISDLKAQLNEKLSEQSKNLESENSHNNENNCNSCTDRLDLTPVWFPDEFHADRINLNLFLPRKDDVFNVLPHRLKTQEDVAKLKTWWSGPYKKWKHLFKGASEFEKFFLFKKLFHLIDSGLYDANPFLAPVEAIDRISELLDLADEKEMHLLMQQKYKAIVESKLKNRSTQKNELFTKEQELYQWLIKKNKACPKSRQLEINPLLALLGYISADIREHPTLQLRRKLDRINSVELNEDTI